MCNELLLLLFVVGFSYKEIYQYIFISGFTSLFQSHTFVKTMVYRDKTHYIQLLTNKKLLELIACVDNYLDI